jgi:hypothetical protein
LMQTPARRWRKALDEAAGAISAMARRRRCRHAVDTAQGAGAKKLRRRRPGRMPVRKDSEIY